MPVTGILAAVDMITTLLGQVNTITALITTAQKENRDVTAAELDGLIKQDDDARKALVNAIAAARSNP